MSLENKTEELLGIGPGSELEPSIRAFRTTLALAQKLRYAMDERLRADGLTTRATMFSVCGLPGATVPTSHVLVALS